MRASGRWVGDITPNRGEDGIVEEPVNFRCLMVKCSIIIHVEGGGVGKNASILSSVRIVYGVIDSRLQWTNKKKKKTSVTNVLIVQHTMMLSILPAVTKQTIKSSNYPHSPFLHPVRS